MDQTLGFSYKHLFCSLFCYFYFCLFVIKFVGANSEVLCHQEGGSDRIWNLRFHRDFHERELGAAFSFLEFIQSRIPRGGGNDTSHWCLKGNGRFDTHSYYNIVRGVVASNFPWKGVWKAKIPRRVSFFVWTAVHGQILTLDNLMLKGRILVNRCCMCH